MIGDILVSAIDYLREIQFLWLICIIMPVGGFLFLRLLRRLFDIPKVSNQNNDIHNYQKNNKPCRSEIKIICNNGTQSQSNKKADYRYKAIFKSLFAHIKRIIGGKKKTCQPKTNDTYALTSYTCRISYIYRYLLQPTTGHLKSLEM